MKNTKEFTKKLTDRGTFLSAIFTLTVVFIVIEFFSFVLINLKEYSQIQVNSSQVIAYLNNLDESTKNELSKKMVELPGVSSVRYESKEIALKAAVKELGVAVNEDENPLNDAFFIYINKNVKLDQLKQSLLNMNEISAVDFRTKVLEKNIEFSKGLDALTVKVSAIFAIVGLIMIYNIVSFLVKSRKKEIYDFLEMGVNAKKLKRTFFRESALIIFVSSILSFGIYQGVRELLVDNIKQLIPSYASTVSILEEAIIAFLLFIVALVIALIISFFAMNRYFKLKTLEKIIVKEENEQNEEEPLKENEKIKEESKEEDKTESDLIGEDNENIWEV